MRKLTLVLSFLCAVNFAFQEPIEQLEQVLVYPVEPATKKTKRESSKSKQKEFKEFVEDKLIQHTQALEHLVTLVESNEEITKRLVENLSHNMGSPKLPEKIEVYNNLRRRSVPEPESAINSEHMKNLLQLLKKNLRLRLAVPWAEDPLLCPINRKMTIQVPGVQWPFCVKEQWIRCVVTMIISAMANLMTFVTCYKSTVIGNIISPSCRLADQFYDFYE